MTPESTERRPGPVARLGQMLLAPAFWLERSRGWKRQALVLLYLTVGLGTLALVYRQTRLAGLPDIGDPFDVRAFRGGDVPAGRDAFELYRKAAERVIPPTFSQPNGRPFADRDWRNEDPEVRAWVLANREALDLWRQGTEREEVTYRGDEGITASLIETLPALALLEGSRLDDQGDLAGAYACYRALLRYSRHIGMRGSVGERFFSSEAHGRARRALERWMADPRLDAAALRKALDDVLAIEATTAPPSDLFKAAYLRVIRDATGPNAPLRAQPRDLRQDMESLSIARLGLYLHVRWLLNNEAERNRRVAQLLFANWLTQVDRPWPQRPQFVSEWRIYDDPRGALPTEELARWLASTYPLVESVPHPSFVEHALGRDRQDQAALILRLAEQLHLRLRGFVPVEPEALVGPCLKELPEGYDPTKPPLGPRPLASAADGSATPVAPGYEPGPDAAALFPPRIERSALETHRLPTDQDLFEAQGPIATP